jgi:plasmid stabilization system protein ParE
MTRRIELRPAAERDLDRLVAFMLELDERAADKRERGLRAALRRLGERPFLGRPGKGHNMRERVIKFGKSSYLIRYRVTDEAVVITRIWHGKEDRPR